MCVHACVRGHASKYVYVHVNVCARVHLHVVRSNVHGGYNRKPARTVTMIAVCTAWDQMLCAGHHNELCVGIGC